MSVYTRPGYSLIILNIFMNCVLEKDNFLSDDDHHDYLWLDMKTSEDCKLFHLSCSFNILFDKTKYPI